MLAKFKRVPLLIVVLLTVFTFTMSFSGCSSDEPKEDPEKQATYDEINAAKNLLSTGDYDLAYQKFNDLVSQNNNEGPKYYKAEAFYGYTLASMMKTINDLVDELKNTLGQALGLVGLSVGDLENGTPEFDRRLLTQAFKEFQPQAGINDIIRGFLYGKLIDPMENWKNALLKVEEVGSLDFYISPFPINIAGIKIMDLSGEHDMGEVYFLQGTINMLLGWLHFFCSIDMSMNIMSGSLMDFLFKYFLPRITDSNYKKIPLVINAATLILNDNPGFLGLNPTVGVQESQTAREDFQFAYSEFANAIAEIESEKDDQSDDVIQYYVDDNGDQYAVFNIHDLNLSTGVIGNSVGGEIPDVTVSTEGKLMLNIGDGLESRLRKLSDNFKPGGPAISWADDIAPIVSALTVMILKSGMLNSIIESAVKDMDESTKKMIDSLLGSSLIDENMITGLLTGFIPDFIAFRFGDFYNNPPNYRDLFPAWTQGITTEVTIDNNKYIIPTDYFIFEYECGNPAMPITDVTGQLGPLMVDSLVCNDTYKDAVATANNGWDGSIIDQPHYTADGWVYKQFDDPNGIINAIEPLSSAGIAYEGFTEDSYKGLLPYMYFPKPSFNHLLMLKLSALVDSDVDTSKLEECSDMMDTFAEPQGASGNKCLNFALNKVFSQILNTLNLANSLVISAK